MSDENSLINYKEVYDRIKKLEDELDELKNILNEDIDDKYSESETIDLSEPSKRFLTFEDIQSIDDKYYTKRRWNNYYKEIIEILENLSDINKVLEIGPYKAPFVVNSDVIDKKDYSDYFPFKINEVIIHDASIVPYPVEDKKYDLIIASQVLEHLGYRGQQVDVFKEMARISKKAIVSLPYKWFRPLHRGHHMIDERVFDAWQGEFDHIYQNISEFTITRVYDFGD